jgi:Ca2+-binding RTX toxin-like protein
MSTINKGTAGNDYITGTQTGNDYLSGGAGNDTIKAWDPGPDSLSDVRHRITDSGWDGLKGEDGNDLLLGGGYSDRLEGGAGQDTLDGGPGSDQLIGGPGSDVFRFEVLYASPGAPTLSSTGDELTFGSTDPGHPTYGFKNDVIEDFHGVHDRFVFNKEVDKIDLKGWENPDHPGAVFVGQGALAADPQLHVAFHFDGYNTIIDLERMFFEPVAGQSYAYNGPTDQIVLLGHHALTAQDFIF